MKTEQQPLTATDLAAFTGSEAFYSHDGPAGMIYTEGVKYLADRAGAYWLIDAIGSHQADVRFNPRFREFQVWTLKVDLERGSAVLICQADTGEPAEVSQVIEFTDFPLETIKLYLCNNVLMLPSEY